MKNPVVTSWTESTRNLFKPVIVLVITFAATVKLSQSLYRYNLRRRSRARSGTMSSSSSSDNGTGVQARRRSRILSSKLYFDIPNSKVPLIYSSAYDITFLGIEKLHPFDSSKWGRICGFLLVDNVVDKNCIVEPLEASKNDLLVVHSEAYLNCLKKSANVAMIIEVPHVAVFPNCLVQQKVLYPFRNQVGGTILAAKLAKERGWAINVGGGFHHCSGEKGGGFCAYADISLCIHFAFEQLNISRVMIIDLDAHQGNGHETDFANDNRVYILDVYNPGIYPFDYEARRYIDQKVEVVSGTTTNEYLRKLDEALEVSVHSFDPELIVYNAGTDILDGDPLGRLKISPDGITNRDEKVFRFARKRNIPIVMLTSGGYMKSSARVIADSITNLSNKCLIDTDKKNNSICDCKEILTVVPFAVCIFLGFMVLLFTFKSYEGPKFSINDAYLTRFNYTETNHTLFYNLSLNITLTNPNKGLPFDLIDIRVTAYYQNKIFGLVSLDHRHTTFHQDPRTHPFFIMELFKDGRFWCWMNDAVIAAHLTVTT